VDDKSAFAPTIGALHVKFSQTYVVTSPKASRFFKSGNNSSNSRGVRLVGFHAMT
jgi:hypothetical protein